VIIRAAQPGELNEVGDVRVAAYRASGFLSETSAYAARLHDLGLDGSGDILVAVAADGTLLGTVMVQYWPNAGGAVQAEGEAEIRALAVLPAARGQGAGNALLQAVIERATTAGVRHLVLATMPAMRTAHRMYERAGFTRLPERDWSPDAEKDVSLLVYGLKLPA
jgi:ribosomal protein S18 acetylase RimI-like enzyme